jgi:hypothetical protein
MSVLFPIPSWLSIFRPQHIMLLLSLSSAHVCQNPTVTATAKAPGKGVHQINQEVQVHSQKSDRIQLIDAHSCITIRLINDSGTNGVWYQVPFSLGAKQFCQFSISKCLLHGFNMQVNVSAPWWPIIQQDTLGYNTSHWHGTRMTAIPAASQVCPSRSVPQCPTKQHCDCFLPNQCSHCHTPSPRWVAVGLRVSLVLPIPSWPLLFEPQHITVPSFNTVHVWNPPAERLVAMAPGQEYTQIKHERAGKLKLKWKAWSIVKCSYSICNQEFLQECW